MRSLLIVFTCVLLVVLIVFVVVNVPTQSKKEIAVKPIDIERQPKPVVEADPAAKHILDFFPKETQPLPVQVPPDITEVPQPVPTEEPAASQPKDRKELDKHNLLAYVHDWVYETYSQVGTTKLGHIRDTRQNVLIKVFVGKQFDNGIEVTQLTAEHVLLKLGESTFRLRRAEVPDFFEDIKKNPRALTPEEQAQAYEYYMIRWGDKFKELSKGYQPPVGMQNPRPITEEEKEKGREEYLKRYGQKFEHHGKNYKVPEMNPEKQQELYQRYWEKYHPNRKMPDFSGMMQSQIHTGPGARVQE